MPKIVKPPTDQTCITLFNESARAANRFSLQSKAGPGVPKGRVYNLSDWMLTGVTRAMEFCLARAGRTTLVYLRNN